MEAIINPIRLQAKKSSIIYLLVAALVLLAVSGCSEREEVGVSQNGPAEDPSLIEQLVLNGHTVDMELAVTPEQRETGLMGRESLADDQGMLFVMPDEDPFPTEVAFWMKGCQIPIDVIFISRDGFIDSIHEMQPPEPDTLDHELPVYYSNGPVQFAIELRGGLAAEIGLNVGDSVDLRKDYLLQLAE